MLKKTLKHFSLNSVTQIIIYISYIFDCRDYCINLTKFSGLNTKKVPT